MDWGVPVTPAIILAPGEHSWSSPNSYLHSWKERIGALGKVFMCQENATSAKDTTVLARNLLKKVQEVQLARPVLPQQIHGVPA